MPWDAGKAGRVPNTFAPGENLSEPHFAKNCEQIPCGLSPLKLGGNNAAKTARNRRIPMYAPTANAVHADSSHVGPELVAAPAAYPMKSLLRAAAAKQIWGGFVLLLIGLVITGISMAIAPGGFFIVTYGAIAMGIVRMVGGIWKLITC
jgi:hypothetical protein